MVIIPRALPLLTLVWCLLPLTTLNSHLGRDSNRNFFFTTAWRNTCVVRHGLSLGNHTTFGFSQRWIQWNVFRKNSIGFDTFDSRCIPSKSNGRYTLSAPPFIKNLSRFWLYLISQVKFSKKKITRLVLTNRKLCYNERLNFKCWLDDSFGEQCYPPCRNIKRIWQMWQYQRILILF